LETQSAVQKTARFFRGMAQVLALPAFREMQPFRIFLWFCEGVDERQRGECDGVCSPPIRLFQA
jgi:hypothetical protein